MANIFVLLQRFAVTCANDNSFFGFPTWYKYLPAGGNSGTASCAFTFTIPDSIPLILLAILEMALRLAGVVAVFYVIYGGIIYVTSQGEPDKVGQAKGTIINALAGVLISTLAVAFVSFIGQKAG